MYFKIADTHNSNFSTKNQRKTKKKILFKHKKESNCDDELKQKQKTESINQKENKEAETKPEEREHKNSMEEWEKRLCVIKRKTSSIDDIIERNTCHAKQGRINSDSMDFSKKITSDGFYKSNCSTLLKRNRPLMTTLERPKSLDFKNMDDNSFFQSCKNTLEVDKEVTKGTKALRKISRSDETIQNSLYSHSLPKTNRVRKKGMFKKSKYYRSMIFTQMHTSN